MAEEKQQKVCAEESCCSEFKDEEGYPAETDEEYDETEELVEADEIPEEAIIPPPKKSEEELVPMQERVVFDQNLPMREGLPRLEDFQIGVIAGSWKAYSHVIIGPRGFLIVPKGRAPYPYPTKPTSYPERYPYVPPKLKAGSEFSEEASNQESKTEKMHRFWPYYYYPPFYPYPYPYPYPYRYPRIRKRRRTGKLQDSIYDLIYDYLKEAGIEILFPEEVITILKSIEAPVLEEPELEPEPDLIAEDRKLASSSSGTTVWDLLSDYLEKAGILFPQELIEILEGIIVPEKEVIEFKKKGSKPFTIIRKPSKLVEVILGILKSIGVERLFPARVVKRWQKIIVPITIKPKPLLGKASTLSESKEEKKIEIQEPPEITEKMEESSSEPVPKTKQERLLKEEEFSKETETDFAKLIVKTFKRGGE